MGASITNTTRPVEGAGGLAGARATTNFRTSQDASNNPAASRPLPGTHQSQRPPDTSQPPPNSELQ